MKKNNLMQFICTLIFAAITLTSCSKDEEHITNDSITPDTEVPDPTGTIRLSMRDRDNGRTYLDNIYIDTENFEGAKFASIGAVRGLGNIINIPTTGWASEVAVVPGNGYVAYSNDKFYRIYVVNYILNTSNGIIGADVKYQDPFKGKDEEIQLETNSLTFPASGGTQTITFKNSGIIPFKVETDVPEWCSVQKTSTFDEYFLTNGIAITVNPNNSSIASEGNIKITTLHDKTCIIKITRAGEEPFIRFSTTSKEYSASEQTESIDFTSNLPFSELSVTSSSSWCKAGIVDNNKIAPKSNIKYIGKSKVDGIISENVATSYSMMISLEENKKQNTRNADITVKSKDGKYSASLNVLQKGITFEIKENRIVLDRNPHTKTIEINTTASDWEAESSENWCTFSKNKNLITIRVTASNVEREAVISFKGFDSKITIQQSKYAVGDKYNEDGISGTVGYIGNDVRYVYSEKLGNAQWSTEDVLTGADSKTDGEYNMNVIKKIPSWQEFYPAFYLCDKLNTNGVTGWYLPAYDEIKKVETGSDFWSSTEYNSTGAYTRKGESVPYYPGHADYVYKSYIRSVYAFRKF